MNKLLIFLTSILKEEKAYAHCDIPCGIYDPFVVQRAAHTIIRMTNMISSLTADINAPFEQRKKIIHDISRLTKVKEEHSDLLEEELETLRNDYFKKEHYKQYPNLTELFTNALKAVSKARQNIDTEAAQSALELVLEISEIFYKSKNVIPVRIKSIYPTEGEIVIYK